ncbi:MAG: hypothetical protein WAM60_03400 [Candidatus Promineifilaceae bacterium]
MLANLTPLEIVTYQAALALQFTDVVTGERVTDGLTVRAWAFDPVAPQLVQRVDEAEKSPNSGVYGFRTMPGLKRYEVGDTVPTGSLAFVVTVVDRFGRFLPQTRRYDLPLAVPAVQLIPLYSNPNRPTPTGFGAIRVQLVRTTAPAGVPPEVTVIQPAAWARIAVTVPADNPGDPPNLLHGLADGRGMALILVPYPVIASNVLLNEAEWSITVGVEYETAALQTDYDLLNIILPDLDQEQTPPFQDTLESQAAAFLFGVVNVVNAADQVYSIVGPPNVTERDFTLQFGRSLILRTEVNGAPDDPLSELLVESA